MVPVILATCPRFTLLRNKNFYNCVQLRWRWHTRGRSLSYHCLVSACATLDALQTPHSPCLPRPTLSHGAAAVQHRNSVFYTSFVVCAVNGGPCECRQAMDGYFATCPGASMRVSGECVRRSTATAFLAWPSAPFDARPRRISRSVTFCLTGGGGGSGGGLLG